MKNLTIVIGAGASYDCVNTGNTNVVANWRPPLVEELFEKRDSFNPILSKFPKAEGASDEIRMKINKNISIETILREFFEINNIALKKRYWEIPLYLQELLREVGNHFVRYGGTKFNTLISDAENSDYEKILVLTLNYDLFLEKAFKAVLGLEFNHIEVSEDYINKGKWSLVKAHGSINWVREILGLKREGVNQNILVALNSLSTDPQFKDLILNNQGDPNSSAINFLNQVHYYPALAAPIEGKNTFMCPDKHIGAAVEHISECSDFLFIGFSGRDEHILELFKKTQKINKLKIVNGTTEWGKEALDRIAKYNNEFLIKDSLKEHAYSGGFVKFMENEAATFLNNG